MNAKHLQDLLEMGHVVEVENKNTGNWLKFVYFNQSKNQVQSSHFFEESSNYSNEQIERDFTNNYRIVTKPPKILEPGTRVEIIDSKELRKLIGWSKKKTEMIGQRGLEIIDWDYEEEYAVYNKNKSDYWYFPHWSVAPTLEEPKYLFDEDGKKVGELLNGEVTLY